MENKIETLNEIDVTSYVETPKANSYIYDENGFPINFLDKENRELVEQIGRYYISTLSAEEEFNLLECLISRIKIRYNSLNLKILSAQSKLEYLTNYLS